MQLFYVPDITLPQYVLGEEESAHCVRVLRLREGDTLHLTDGRGNMYRAEITEAHPKRCAVRIVEIREEFGKRPYRLTVAVAPTKNIDRFEWFLEKATETGVDRIIPMECEHSERRTIKRERQERVITSAVKQSLKAYHPVLEAMTPFSDVIAGKPAAPGGTPFEGIKLMAHCREGERRFIGDYVKAGQDVMILIGPEGDFSQREADLAAAAGFIPVTLGDSRLRTETAALAAVTIVSFINNCESSGR